MGGNRFTSLSLSDPRPCLKPLHLCTQLPKHSHGLAQLVHVERATSGLPAHLEGLGEGATALGFAGEDP